MAQYQITVNEEILQHVFSNNDDGMANLLKEVLDQVLELQRTEQLKAKSYERK